MIGNFQVIWVNHARIHKLGRVTSSILDHFGWGIDRSLSPSNPKPRNIAGEGTNWLSPAFPDFLKYRFLLQIQTSPSCIHVFLAVSEGLRFDGYNMLQISGARRRACRLPPKLGQWFDDTQRTAASHVQNHTPVISHILCAKHTHSQNGLFMKFIEIVCVYLYILLCIIYIYRHIHPYQREDTFICRNWLIIGDGYPLNTNIMRHLWIYPSYIA